MAKRIDIYSNKSLDELDFEREELLAFDNNDCDWSSPLVLAIPKRIFRGYKNPQQGLRLLWAPSNGKREEWTLDFKGRMLEVWSPRYKSNGSRGPNYSVKEEGTPQTTPYFIETAIAGRAAIQDYLRTSKSGMDFYVEVMESGEFNFFLKPLKI